MRWENWVTDLNKPLASRRGRRRDYITLTPEPVAYWLEWHLTIHVPQIDCMTLLHLIKGRQRQLSTIDQILCKQRLDICWVKELMKTFRGMRRRRVRKDRPGVLMQRTCSGSSTLATASSTMPSASTTAHCNRLNCSSCSFCWNSPESRLNCTEKKITH